MEVYIKEPGNEAEFDKAVKTFKKMIMKSGILQEIKDRRYFITPSERKRAARKMLQRGKRE
jgi:ribosomal protein S21